MTTFDEREQAFERRFVQDEQTRFRTRVRRTEIDQRQPPQGSLDAGMAPNQDLQGVERDVSDQAGRERPQSARRHGRACRTGAAEVARKGQANDAAGAVEQHVVAASHPAQDQVRCSRVRRRADVGLSRHQFRLKPKGEKDLPFPSPSRAAASSRWMSRASGPRAGIRPP